MGKKPFTVKQDRDGWYRVAKNNKTLKATPDWHNLYMFKAGCTAAARVMNSRHMEGR